MSRSGGSWWGQRAYSPCNLNAHNVEQHGYLLFFPYYIDHVNSSFSMYALWGITISLIWHTKFPSFGCDYQKLNISYVGLMSNSYREVWSKMLDWLLIESHVFRMLGLFWILELES